MIDIIIHGKPIPNNTKYGVNKYTKKMVSYKTKPVINYKTLIQHELNKYIIKNNIKVISKAVKLDLFIYLEMPKSWSKKKKEHLCGKFAPNKPDTSNLLKLIEDAISKDRWNNYAYILNDDKLICKHNIEKRYDYNGWIRIIINEISNE